MGWLDNWRRGRAIKSYARCLPRLLVKDYGGAEAYAPAQIRASIRRHRLNPAFESHAVAMFSDRERFERFRAEFGERRGYDEVRGEVATSYFGGADVNFAAVDFFSDTSTVEGGASGYGSGDISGHHWH